MEPAGGAAISVRDLVRRFGELDAVRGVSFEVPQGQTFGFLGPNGAGKSTTISMLCTLLRPTSGSARVAGFDVVSERAEVRKRIGLVFQDTTLDDYLTAQENLRFHAELYGVPRHQTAERIADVLNMVGLFDRRDGLVRTFSGGMKRRLEIARGLLHSPRVLFLEEPTVGLDPQTRSHIWGYINELRQREAITMFLTTHYSPSLIFTLIAEMLLAAITITALGTALASRISQIESFQVVMQFVVLPLFFLSGALFPLRALPTWLAVLTKFDPLAYIVDPMRRAVFEHVRTTPQIRALFAGGVTWNGWRVPIGVELGLTALIGALLLGGAIYTFGRSD